MRRIWQAAPVAVFLLAAVAPVTMLLGALAVATGPVNAPEVAPGLAAVHD